MDTTRPFSEKVVRSRAAVEGQYASTATISPVRSCQTTNSGHVAAPYPELCQPSPLPSRARCHSGGSVVDVTVALLAADATHVAPVGRRP
jgi:hypothetical protein